MKKDIRKKFRNDVFERDGYKCKMCGDSNSKLDAHHITDRSEMPNGGYVKENGITLCDKPNGCHMKAEMYHKYTEIWVRKNLSKDYHDYIPDNLYKKINSIYEIAYKKSERL